MNHNQEDAVIYPQADIDAYKEWVKVLDNIKKYS